MSELELLEYFGKTVMSSVRDYTLDTYDRTVSGHMKSAELRSLHERIKGLSAEQKALLRDVVTRMVDHTLHNFLWMLEQQQGMDLIVADDDGESISVAKVSDGLCGELYTEGGWIHRFSTHS